MRFPQRQSLVIAVVVALLAPMSAAPRDPFAAVPQKLRATLVAALKAYRQADGDHDWAKQYQLLAPLQLKPGLTQAQYVADATKLQSQNPQAGLAEIYPVRVNSANTLGAEMTGKLQFKFIGCGQTERAGKTVYYKVKTDTFWDPSAQQFHFSPWFYPAKWDGTPIPCKPAGKALSDY